jgi:hypothetical protein
LKHWSWPEAVAVVVHFLPVLVEVVVEPVD